MRILHVYSGNLFGGVESILVSLARQRAANVAHEFALCFEGRLAGELRAAGAAVHPLAPVRVSRPHTIRQARRRLTSLLATHTWDAAIAHAPWSLALFGATVRGGRVPLAFWAHDAWSGRHWTERWARRVTPDLLIANSRFTAHTVPSIDDMPREVVYAPVDRPASLSSQDRTAIRTALGTPASAVVIVQASRMESWKGHPMLLRTLASLRDNARWYCWIVGGAQRPSERAYADSLQRLASDLGIADRVRFAGERADVARLFAAADVYAQPNVRPEPFGVAFVEALAAGLPVVTSDLGAAGEIVDGSCGRLVPAADEDAWRCTLQSLLADDAVRVRLAGAGPARAALLCDPSRQTRRLEQALASISRVAVAG